MKVTSERLPESRVQMMIEADEEATRKAQEAAFRQVVGRVNVPGFRRGKAPRTIVERMLGRDAIMREAAQILLPDLYEQALAETGVDPMYDPDVDIITLEPLSFKVIVAVRPTVQLPEYQNIRLPKEEVAVTEEQVDESLANVREQHAVWTPVERPVQVGDTVALDTVAEANSDKILDANGIEYLVDPERGLPTPGFAEQVVGMSADEDKTFTLTFPADYQPADLAGKEAEFKVKVHAVKEKRMPELDDDLAKTAGEFDTLEQLRDSLRERLQANLQARADSEYEDTVVSTVVEQSQMEIPAQMVEEQTEGSLHSLEDRLQAQGVAMPEYLSAMRQSRIQLLEGLREDARVALRRQLVLNEVAKLENIEIPDAEIDAEIEGTVALFGEHADEARKTLDTPEQRRSIAFRLNQRKARERLARIASQPAEGAAAAQPEG
ncbi:MAG: trigger factor [Chloroflexota bacterium]